MNYKKLGDEYLRIIKTARSLEEINQATKDGFFPMVLEAEYSEKYYSKYKVWQCQKTGKIELQGDFRGNRFSDNESMTPFTDWIKQYDYPNSPFAAYLVPEDLQLGERVYLNDVIENLTAGSWNQGDCWRVKEAAATYTGSEFKIEHQVPIEMMG